MTQDQKGLFSSRQCSQEFLFYQTDATHKDAPSEDAVPAESTELLKAFPKMLAGKAFLDHAMARLDGTPKFAALAVRIDDFNVKENAGKSDSDADVRVDVARAIDTICQNEAGIWGQLDQDMLGCLFFETDETSATKLAESIKSSLAAHRPETVSIAIAVYPLIDFLKNEIFDNTRKALDHAAFFGPDSSVVFDAVSLNISGDKLYQKGDINGAVNEFKKALRLDPSNVNVHNSLGVCYGILDNFKDAKLEFRETIRLDPEETMAVYNLGLVYLLSENKEKALEHFLEAAGQAEDIFEVVLQTGKTYLETGQPEKSKFYLEKAVDLKPESPVAYRLLGEYCAAMNLTDEAVAAYKKAIRHNPNDSDSLSALGYLFDLQGENPEITTIFCQQSVDISPENGLFRHRLGSLYLKQNLLKEALEQFQKADEMGHDSKEIIIKIEKLMQDV
ncbi:MAG: tetratricopeptide repeat protein [Desulfobacterales bacterium]|uniref:Tetratricopeptide repeat protein n=1 Tax=Candidatus Desulfatibia vada TaxID=2841696 RepID=A0A8J6TTH7_9BACT|nr:tetratricopeptide repeat protein [Candidatus Desulfatibia vada]